MHKESREQAWKATSKARTKPINEQYDADIVNLNKDNDFIPLEEEVEVEERAPLTEEEKKEVRKKLFILLIAIVVALVVMIIMLIFDPFSGADKKDNKDKEKPVVVEKEEEKEENKPLKAMKDGSISLSHEEVVELLEMVELNNHEHMFNETVAIYTAVPFNFSKISNRNKLFFTSKSNDFKKTFETKIANDNVCASELNFTTTEMSELVKKVLNTEISEHVSFVYSYYDGDTFIKDIKFTKQDDLYIGKCLGNQTTPKGIVQQQVVKATKEKNKLHIDVATVFANQTGVYKDPTFKTLITNDKTATTDKYISNGATYRHTFDLSTENYYLESISLLK